MPKGRWTIFQQIRPLEVKAEAIFRAGDKFTSGLRKLEKCGRHKWLK
jgi:hypothetical protein